MPSLFPIALNLEGRPCVVVGGGQIAARRVRSLLDCGALVRVIDPEVSAEIIHLGADIQSKEFDPEDLQDAFLVFAATDETQVNSAIVSECKRQGILCNDASSSGPSDFVIPAVARRGDLILSVTTGGASPILSARVRDQLLQHYGPEYEPFVRLLSELREIVLHNIGDASRRREILTKAAEDDNALQLIRENRIPEARDRLIQCISTSQA